MKKKGEFFSVLFHSFKKYCSSLKIYRHLYQEIKAGKFDIEDVWPCENSTNNLSFRREKRRVVFKKNLNALFAR